MSKSRHLAAILFTDIEGYTALMQENEANALAAVKKHNHSVQQRSKDHGGEVSNFYGDGCLLIFPSATEAVQCAIDIQEDMKKLPAVPLRIGIHIGEIFYEDGKVFGDGVNITSRIQTLAVANSILISSEIHTQIKNRPDFNLVSLGSFNFKNVMLPMEIYALANDGLVVPDKNSLKGKVDETKGSNDPASKFTRNAILLLSIFAGYWILFQFSSFIITKFYISNVWSDIIQFFLLSISPSVIVIAFVNKRNLKRIFIPANSVLSVVLTGILFINKPLGLYANSVEITNEKGKKEIIHAIKSEYQVSLGVLLFTVPDQPDTLAWLKRGIGSMLSADLEATDVVRVEIKNTESSENLNEILNRPENSKLDYILSGSINSSKDNFVVDYKLYNLLGKEIKQNSISHSDIFNLIDQLSKEILVSVEIPKPINEIKDLPLRTVTTESYHAMKYYVESLSYHPNSHESIERLAKSISFDSTFIQPIRWLAESIGSLGWQSALKKGIELLELAIPHRAKLAEPQQLALLMQYYSYKDLPKAVELALKLAQLYPDDHSVMDEVATILGMDDSYFPVYKKYMLSVYSQLEYSQKIELFNVSMFHGDKEILELLNKEIEKDAFNKDWLSMRFEYLYSMGELSQAKEAHNEVATLAPEAVWLNELSKVIDNYNLVNLDGNYRSMSDRYERKIIRNRYGIPFGIYSLLNNKGLIYIHSRNTIKFIGEAKASLHYASNGAIYGWSQYSTILFKNSDAVIQLEKNLADKSYQTVEKNIDALITRHPNHFFLKNYKKHLDFIKTQSPIDSSIIGKYKLNANETIKVYKKGNKLVYESSNLRTGTNELLALSSTTFSNLGCYSCGYQFQNDGKSKELLMSIYYPIGDSISIAGKLRKIED